MILASNVRKIPSWWRYVPFLGVEIAAIIYPYIYLPKLVYENLQSNNPGVLEKSILLHETTHLKRQIEIGIFVWHLKYIFSPNFRLQEEVYAIATQMEYLKKHKYEYDYDRKARQFSSSTYFWMLSYKKSYILLKNIWENIDGRG